MKGLLLCIIIFFVLTPQIWAGWKIVSHQNQEGEQQTVTYFIEKDRLKISGNGFDFIYDKVENQVVIVNHKIKSYYQGNFDEYQSQLEDILRIDKKLAKKILPKTYIQRLDATLAKRIQDNQTAGKMGIPSLNVQQRQSKTTLASFEAAKYEVFYDSSLIQSIWFSTDVRVFDDINTFQAINFLNGTKEARLSQSTILNTQEYDQLQLKGFPLRILNVDSYGMIAYSEECISVLEINLDIEENFTAPHQYKPLTLVDIIMSESQN